MDAQQSLHMAEVSDQLAAKTQAAETTSPASPAVEIRDHHVYKQLHERYHDAPGFAFDSAVGSIAFHGHEVARLCADLARHDDDAVVELYEAGGSRPTTTTDDDAAATYVCMEVLAPNHALPTSVTTYTTFGAGPHHHDAERGRMDTHTRVLLSIYIGLVLMSLVLCVVVGVGAYLHVGFGGGAGAGSGASKNG